MSGILGLLGRSSGDDTMINTIGQRVVYDASQQLLGRYNADLEKAMMVFVEGETDEYKWRYKSPGGGTMARRGRQAQGPAVRPYGEWDVALPLEDFGEQIAGDDVSMAYMTISEFDLYLQNQMIRHTNLVRFEMLLKLFKNTNTTFTDPLKGDLTVVPLANGDSVTYPPVLGATAEATDTHYLESGYAATAISDTNNPYITIRDELEEHFGTMTGGNNIVVFINQAETPETEALTDFVEVQDRFIRAGDNVDIPENLPNVPGRIIGRVNGVWVSEWRHMPANYMLGVHLEEPKPLMKRVDPANTGLPRGLTLVAEDGAYPFKQAHWRSRFGFGVVNRLNGVVMELGSGGSYTIPTAYQ